MIELPAVALPSGLPALDPESQAHARLVRDRMAQAIEQAGGWLAFEDWMRMALYAPAAGYYSAGSAKFSHAGDFTTAPELDPIFGRTLALQVAQILAAARCPQVLEFGAGSGALAAALIPALQELGIAADYRIIELSADLRARQQARLAHLRPAVQWLDALPDSFSGCVLANEVLDAMPACLFARDQEGALHELGVGLNPARDTLDTPFCWAARPVRADLQDLAGQRIPPLPGYRSEINREAEAWIRQMGQWLVRGAALLIDYGFPQREYYHPQRMHGTLMCHFRHLAHDQPLVLAGMQDITTHVDFTAMADAALEGGLDVLGYASQARFLMNCGLVEHIGSPVTDPTERARRLAAINMLTSEAEMGELFKVLAIGRDLDAGLSGFARGDRRDAL